MPRLDLLPTLLREVFAERALPREPEPDLVMEGPEQVAAFAEAGRIQGVMSASYLFNSARISQAIQGCREVIDLGCGPATQLAQIAEFNPDIDFLGVDLSQQMLDSAQAHVTDLGLSNVRFQREDIAALSGIPDRSADGVISTVALHHLPSHAHLESCLGQIARILRPGGAVYLVDLGRLKSVYSAIYFAYMNAAHQPHLFSLDYERSLRAAFLPEDFRQLAQRHLPACEVYTPLAIRVLIICKTADRPLPEATRARLGQMRAALAPRYRRDLDDIRRFFRWGGLGNDPFA